jgi:hypothetical protein
MAHLTLQEVIERVNSNYFYYSARELRRERNRDVTRPHHPAFYVPRITRMFAGLMFNAVRAANKMTTVQKADTPYSVPS